MLCEAPAAWALVPGRNRLGRESGPGLALAPGVSLPEVLGYRTKVRRLVDPPLLPPWPRSSRLPEAGTLLEHTCAPSSGTVPRHEREGVTRVKA